MNDILVEQEIIWQQLECRLLKLQKRIYRASHLGKISLVRRLQKTLISSWSAKCIAIKRAIAFDRLQLSFPEIASLATDLKVNVDSNIRSKKMKIIFDRAKKIVIEMAIKTELKAKREFYEENLNYSSVVANFNSVQDRKNAIFKINQTLDNQPQFVMQIDWQTCLDYSSLNNSIVPWKFLHKFSGQFLLDRIISCSIEEVKINFYNWLFTKSTTQKQELKSLVAIEYQSHLLLFSEQIDLLQKCREGLYQLMQNRGLNCDLDLIEVNHTLYSYKDRKAGFDFLGLHWQQYLVGKYNSQLNNVGKLLRFRTIILPSKQATKEHSQKLSQLIDQFRGKSVKILIKKLNFQIRKWVNYYLFIVNSTVDRRVFKKLDRLLFIKLWQWVKYRHSRKSARFRKEKYWHTIGNKNWIFAIESKGQIAMQLYSHVRGTQNKCYISEEPCEGKLSRTVLKPNQKSDFLI